MPQRLFTVACAAAVFVAGCTTPPPHFYTLTQTPASHPAKSSCKVAVVVGPVSIPAMVNVPQMVVSTGPNQVALNEFNRWASPLQNNISRVVAEDLVTMLGTQQVALFPQALHVDFDYYVAIEVQSFESEPGQAATLNALWTVRRSKDGNTQTGRTNLREPTQGPGYDAVAAAHSLALAQLSEDIAERIRMQGCWPP
jgi:uncharacterized protein